MAGREVCLGGRALELAAEVGLELYSGEDAGDECGEDFLTTALWAIGAGHAMDAEGEGSRLEWQRCVGSLEFDLIEKSNFIPETLTPLPGIRAISGKCPALPAHSPKGGVPSAPLRGCYAIAHLCERDATRIRQQASRASQNTLSEAKDR